MRDKRWICPKCSNVNVKSSLQAVFETNIENGVTLYGDETCYGCYAHTPMEVIYRGEYDAISSNAPLTQQVEESPSDDVTSFEFAYNISYTTDAGEPAIEDEVTGPFGLSLSTDSSLGVPELSPGGFAVTRGFEDTASTAIHPPQVTPTPEPVTDDLSLRVVSGESPRTVSGSIPVTTLDSSLSPLDSSDAVVPPPQALSAPDPVAPPTAPQRVEAGAHAVHGDAPGPHHIAFPERFQCPVCQRNLRYSGMSGDDFTCSNCHFTFTPLPFVQIPPHVNIIADLKEREFYFEQILELIKDIDLNNLEQANMALNNLLDLNPSSGIIWLDKALVSYWRAIRRNFDSEDVYDILYYLQRATTLGRDDVEIHMLAKRVCEQLLAVSQYILDSDHEFNVYGAGDAPSALAMRTKYKGNITQIMVVLDAIMGHS